MRQLYKLGIIAKKKKLNFISILNILSIRIIIIVFITVAQSVFPYGIV